MPDVHEPVEPSAVNARRSHCTRYGSGHRPSTVLVGLCQQSPAEDWQRVVVLGAVGDEIVLAMEDGEVRRYRNHEPAFLLWVVSRVGPEMVLNTGYGGLFSAPWPSGGWSSIFSVQEVEERAEPCLLPRP